MLPDDPLVYAALVAVLALGVVAQKFLGWTAYARLHRAKQVLFPLLQPHVNVLLVSRKGYRESDAEYLTTVEDSVRGVWASLGAAGASPHLLNSVKERPLPDGGEQLSAAHLVWIHNDASQTEVYLFDAPDGVDIYAHHEPVVTDADAHLNGVQTDGDPTGVVWEALIDAYATGRKEST